VLATVSLILTSASATARAQSARDVAAADASPAPEPAADPASAAAALRRPGPGRVPVQVDSTNGPLLVGTDVPIPNLAGVPLSIPRDVCITPCTLFLAPGLQRIRYHGGGASRLVSPVDVPESGLHLQLRAPSVGIGAAAVTFGAFGAAGLLTGGVTVLFGVTAHHDAMMADPLLHSVDPSGTLLLAGGVTMAAGAALLTTGIILGVINRAGIESVTPLDARPTARRARPALGLAVAPTRDGGFATVGGVF
jgi:hypothetical protein